jgi:5-methylcytosine-specific restriction endonuclease McrA
MNGTGTPGGHVPLAPPCPRCRRRHLTDLPCWQGAYSIQVTAALFETVPPRRPCWICGRDGSNTADHVTPRSHGGTDALANLRPAHGPCNSARGNRDPFETTEHTEPEPISPRWRILTLKRNAE